MDYSDFDCYRKGKPIKLKDLFDKLNDYFKTDQDVLNVNLKDGWDKEYRYWFPIFSGTYETMLLELKSQIEMNGPNKEILLIDF
jgi:hypothetical protein